LQLSAWLKPNLLTQHLPGALIGLERIRLPTVPVEGKHELAVGTLAQWLCCDQLFELGYQHGAAPSGQVGVDPILQDREACFFKLTGSVLRERLVAKIREGRAPPDRKRVAKKPRIALRATFLRELLEAVQVELALLEAKAVPGRLSYEPVLSERSSQLGDGVLENLRGYRRWLLSPKRVDQAVARHELVGMQEEVGEERKLLPALKHDGASFVDYLEWSEDQELHQPRSTVTPAVLQANLRIGFTP
jgi:hypothetical protein